MPSVRNIQAQQRPRPHPARPGGVDAAFDQGRDGEGERDREADIAEIEHRRMDREAEILQDRIEVAALERRLREAQERVRGEQDEQIEGAGDPRLHRQHVGLQASPADWRRTAATSAPNSARMSTHSSIEPSWLPHTLVNLVDQRHHRMRILEDVGDREVRRDVADRQRARTRARRRRTAPARWSCASLISAHRPCARR